MVLRFEDQIMGSKLFHKYSISWVEIQEVQLTLADCEKNLNLFSIHFHKICSQQKIRCWSSQYHLSLWLAIDHTVHPHTVVNKLRFLVALTFRRRIKSRLPFAGIIRRLPYSTRFQDKG